MNLKSITRQLLFVLCTYGATTCLQAQVSATSQIVFTALDANGDDQLWTRRTSNNVYTLLNPVFDNLAIQAGKHEGPITVAKNGGWYVFRSERFDPDANGWSALTIMDIGANAVQTVRTASGNVIHNEGIAQISSDGCKLVYYDNPGTGHQRDIFLVTRASTQSAWSDPLNLTAGSGYDYNTTPYFDANHTQILFEGSDMPYSPTAIMQVDLSGANLISIVTNSSGSFTEVKSPAYLSNGHIVFEATSQQGEQVWRMPIGGTPSVVNGAYSDDNSPVVLPNGGIVSLYIGSGSSIHLLKTMNDDGTNPNVLSNLDANNTPIYIEVSDVGISAGVLDPLLGTTYTNTHTEQAIFISPNPITDGYFQVKAPASASTLEIFNVLGENVYTQYAPQGGTFDCHLDRHGIFIAKLSTEQTTSVQTLIIE
jgi:hypothetical protein